jgi:branched-chain amino acid transport system substrate-binding protein
MNDLKVGVLLPRSSLYRTIGNDIIAGIKSGLKHKGLSQASFCTANIGYGGSDSEVYAKAEKMLLEEEPDIVIAFVDHYASTKIVQLFEGARKLLLTIDPGAYAPKSWDASPYRFSISLQAALCSRLTGRMAVEQDARKNIFATSFYEGGYLNCYSFMRGMEKAGGMVFHNDIIPYKLDDYSAAGLDKAISDEKPDAVLAQFSAEAGEVFLRSFPESAAGLKIYASSFLLEEEWLSGMPFRTENITGCVPWGSGLDNEENKLFKEKIKEASGKNANVFHLLGWEAALFCGLFIIANKAHGRNAGAISAELEAAVLDSPRGKLVMDATTHHFFGPIYVARVVKDTTGNCAVDLVKKAAFTVDDQIEYINDPPPGIVSRWTNTYLCI